MSQADWDRLQYYSRKVKFFIAINTDPQVHPSTYFRIAQLQSSALLPSLRRLHYNLSDRSISHIFLFLSPLLDSLELSNIGGFGNTIAGPFLATLASKFQMLSRIVLSSGHISVDILKKSIVHFKQLRSLELTDAVFMSDFVLWEVLGTLPSLVNLTLTAYDPASHPAHAPENSNNQNGGPKYFEALESLSVMGSFFLIQHLLGFIDSSCLKSINVYPIVNRVRNEHEPELTPSMTIIASKWSRSLKDLFIGSRPLALSPHSNAISKSLMLLKDVQEMQDFQLLGWGLENTDDDVRHLVMSWPKLTTFGLYSLQTCISLSTLRIIAENCPELRHLSIRLDTSTNPPFDISSKSLRHNLEVLNQSVLAEVNPSDAITRTTLERQIQVARHLDLIFPYLKSINAQRDDTTWSSIRDLVKLCQDARRVT